MTARRRGRPAPPEARLRRWASSRLCHRARRVAADRRVRAASIGRSVREARREGPGRRKSFAPGLELGRPSGGARRSHAVRVPQRSTCGACGLGSPSGLRIDEAFPQASASGAIYVFGSHSEASALGLAPSMEAAGRAGSGRGRATGAERGRRASATTTRSHCIASSASWNTASSTLDRVPAVRSSRARGRQRATVRVGLASRRAGGAQPRRDAGERRLAVDGSPDWLSALCRSRACSSSTMRMSSRARRRPYSWSISAWAMRSR